MSTTATATTSAPSLTATGKVPSPPKVDSFDLNTTPNETLIKSITKNGAIIVRNFLDESSLDAIEKDLRPHLEGDTPWDGACFPPQTRRVAGIVAKSDAYREKLIMHPRWLELSDALLTIKTSSWFGDAHTEGVSRPQLSGSVAFSILPGAKAQGLHRDDMVFHERKPRITAEEYEIGRDVGLGLFVAGTKTTKENGATRFCPGSHLEASGEAPNEDNAIYGEMEKGEALIMFLSCYHAGSANMTADFERLVYNACMIRGTLRQGENQYVLVPKEQAAEWDEETLRVCGYAVSHPFLGFVDFMDPMVHIKGGEGKRYDVTDSKAV
ncbi:MAG: hypothetical protein M1817_001622 [Caeruleum heppii]|nr:MAG: hypothetical protein M1817_001622 [Caeruleum heppii]